MLKSYIPQYIKKVDDLTRFGEDAGGFLATFIKKELDLGSGSGKVYEHDGKLHRASAPGKPPKTETGALSRSVSSKRSGTGKSEVRIKSPYAALLEYGTSKMRPRPFVAPALLELIKQIQKKFKEDWQ